MAVRGIEPEDGLTCTWSDMAACYDGESGVQVLSDYWFECSEEGRIDSLDGTTYTWKEFRDYYEDQFTRSVLKEYWHSCCPGHRMIQMV